MIDEFYDAFNKLEKYCLDELFKGYDPYDGLNSPFYQSIPLFSKIRLIRLIWIQVYKRSTINLRRVSGIKKEYNPKALGLFLIGYCNLYKQKKEQKYLDKIHFFSEKILETANSKYKYACWGYNFDWQSRAFFLPKNSPTIVVSSFIANALLDSWEIIHDEKLFLAARSTCEFIMKELYRTYDNEGDFAFSYSPYDKSVVFNASLLGGRLLARIYSISHEKELIDTAKRVVNFCSKFQQEDGSWNYGTQSYHQWIDNFHTGYNLECIAEYMKYTGDHSFVKPLNKGYEYYIQTFFTEEGIPKYYNNSVYPIDIHAPAQLVITLSKMNKFMEQKEMIDKVLTWTIRNMQSDKGYFYYQINRFFTSRIPYMRWSQAWMFYALSEYFLQIDNNKEG